VQAKLIEKLIRLLGSERVLHDPSNRRVNQLRRAT